MNSFSILWSKEWKEALRTSKIIWLPAVFLMLGIMQPIMAVMMPDILKSAGSLPKGTVIEIPAPQAGEVLGQTLSQYGTIGLLAVCLAFMGMISGERRSGAAAWVLVKPVSWAAYTMSKWAASTVLTLGSFAVGFAVCWYETALLVGTPDAGEAIAAAAAYGGWLMFICAAVLAAGAWFPAPAAAAFVPFAGATALLLIQGLAPDRLTVLPSALAEQAVAAVRTGGIPQVGAACWTTAALLVLLIALAAAGVRSRRLRL